MNILIKHVFGKKNRNYVFCLFIVLVVFCYIINGQLQFNQSIQLMWSVSFPFFMVVEALLEVSLGFLRNFIYLFEWSGNFQLFCSFHFLFCNLWDYTGHILPDSRWLFLFISAIVYYDCDYDGGNTKFWLLFVDLLRNNYDKTQCH